MHERINAFIDKLHFKSYDHIIDKVVNAYPNVELDDIKKIVNDRLHDHYMTRRKIAPYYVHIFSTATNCWFHDLMDNSKHSLNQDNGNNTPRY